MAYGDNVSRNLLKGIDCARMACYAMRNKACGDKLCSCAAQSSSLERESSAIGSLWRTTPPNEERGSGWWRTWAKRESFTAVDWQNLAERLGQPDMAAALEYRVKNVRRGRPGTRQAPWTPECGDELVPIYLDQVGWGNPRRFGDVYVALRFWKRLGLGNLLSKLLRGRSSEINALVCAMMVANRLVSPESELGMLGWWGKTSLPELLGLPVESVDDHRLYRSLDAILPHKERIEEHLAGVGRGLFGREYTALLYDLTSTYLPGLRGRYFQGQAWVFSGQASRCETGVYRHSGGLGWIPGGLRGV